VKKMNFNITDEAREFIRKEVPGENVRFYVRRKV
jgi:uncharacterized protein YneR